MENMNPNINKKERKRKKRPLHWEAEQAIHIFYLHAPPWTGCGNVTPVQCFQIKINAL